MQTQPFSFLYCYGHAGSNILLNNVDVHTKRDGMDQSRRAWHVAETPHALQLATFVEKRDGLLHTKNESAANKIRKQM